MDLRYIYLTNIDIYYETQSLYGLLEGMLNNPLLEGMLSGLILGVKSCIMIFIFI